MRTALRGASARSGRVPHPVINVRSLPPPTGGWNTRDALPSMKPSEALRLDNLVPDLGKVALRRGYSQHATGISGSYVESIMEYSPPSGTTKLFAAGPTIIYDATSAGAASSSQTLLSNGRWQDTMFANTTGNYMYIVNGADTPRYYDGSSWTNSTFTGSGLTISNLIHVVSHMNRLWFTENNTLNAWYGPTSAISGTLTKFLPPFKMGGYLQAIGSWSRDGGSGPDDHIVFLSSKGECAVYAGTDPSSASTSALIGIFRIPEPIGRRCMMPVGGDLAILTSQGVVPLSLILSTGPAGAARVAITDKIAPTFRDSYISQGTAYGWQMVEYPKKNLLIVNVPVAERVTQYQYVMNIKTGAWCRFTGINANCWRLVGDNLYFGGIDGKVYKYDTGYLDGSSNIVAINQSAYNSLGSQQTKRVVEARPNLLAPTGYNAPVTIQTDYDVSTPAITVVAASTAGTQWDVGQWDTFQWAGGTVPSLGWQGVAAEGSAISVAFGISASEEIIYNGVDLKFEAGNYQ